MSTPIEVSTEGRPAPSRRQPPQTGQIYLSLPQICSRYAIHRATAYRWMKKRGFPRPVQFSSACARVPLDEIENWEAQQRQARG